MKVEVEILLFFGKISMKTLKFFYFFDNVICNITNYTGKEQR